MCTPAIGSIPVAFKFSFSFSIFHSFSSSLLSSLSRVAFLLSPFLLLPVRRPESYFPAIFPAACNSPSPSELNQSFQFEAVAIFCSDIGAERGKMASQSGASRRSISSSTRRASESGAPRKSISSSRPLALAGERTVKSLRLTKALTVPETTTVYEACRRMAARRVDALLLTDSNALLCGILTDKDIAARVIAKEINLEETPVSKVMTRNPVFVLSETLAAEALQKMVQGKFRHLPVVENGEVLALLDIAKCLHDAIARMERAAEKGKAIAAAVEGVEKHWGTSGSAL
ncbi:CBS domain-containing protein CBSCBSPB1 [Glycine soja]|nr:CBS domain-containing protein CBSCBSPB1 [Glycine max]KAH1255135.1 CBS domain-containing protein CBSCBSPB1 [Glycine max]KAH1255138.1 CBS domain-containing protein CBSCBSPB1 [Glycine max]